jgi:hypothetical protein
VTHQHPGLFHFGGRPHQRRSIGVIPLIGIGAQLQQAFQRGRIRVEHSVHEGRGTLGSARVEQLRVPGDEFHELRKIALVQRVDHGELPWD